MHDTLTARTGTATSDREVIDTLVDRSAPDLTKLLRDQALKAAERFARGAGAGPAATTARARRRIEMIPAGDVLGIERVIGESDFLPVGFLEMGVRRSRSVCRIEIFDPRGRPAGYGTGFLVAPGLLLTNHHVLPDAAHAATSTAEFGFEKDADFRNLEPEVYDLQPDRFFHASKELDYALVAVAPESSGGVALTRFGFFPLIEESGKALAGEKLSIVQHPAGRQKMVTLRNNSVLNPTSGDFVHYECDTEEGTSGSPVCNDQWEVVALHHSGVPMTDPDGHVLKKDGQPHRDGEPDEWIDWIANEGVRISSIFANLAGHLSSWRRPELLEVATLSSTGSFAAAVAAALGREPSATRERMEATTKPVAEPAASRISIEQLWELAETEGVSEEDLAPYLIQREPRADRFDPVFEINPERVALGASAAELSMAGRAANYPFILRRKMAYSRKVAAARATGKKLTRIVAEGDSWFQYPLVLRDVIDHLMDVDDIAIRCFSEAGDVLSEMVTRLGVRNMVLDAIERESADVFLMSAGGNDMVDGGGLPSLLEPHRDGMEAHAYLGATWRAFLDRIEADYRRVFQQVWRRKPDVRIVCHGYDHAIPNGQVWLGKPLAKMKVTDPALQKAILRAITNDFNDRIEKVVKEAGSKAAYADCRDAVSPDGWHNEYHPDSDNFEKVALRILAKVRP